MQLQKGPTERDFPGALKAKATHIPHRHLSQTATAPKEIIHTGAFSD